MKLAEFSVHRPVFTIMVTFIVILLGGISFIHIPVDLMPEISFPTLSISASYENASSQEMEELVTRPIEQAMSAVPGIEEMTSVSAEGMSSVRMSFTWGTDLDAAANDVRDRLDRVIPRLPEDVERPSLRKFDLASFPILFIGAASKLDPIQMRMLIDNQIKQRIERLPGVASLDVFGGLNREIHADLYPDKIKALGLPLDMILSRLRAENINVPAGTIERGNYEIMLRTPGIYTNIEDIRNTVITIRDGAPIQLKEIADISDSWQRVTRIVKVNGEPGIRLSINKQSGKNTVEVARGVLEEIERLNKDFPQLRLVPISDTSNYIKRSIRNVGTSAVFGGILAILVLLVFLRNLRSTLIIGTAIPISIIATFALMYFNGYTLNLMSLGGLALGIGMLLDNSIVVLENIFRLKESGYSSEKAAVEGSNEVTNAIIASTLTTIAVFLPLVFIQGMAGVMFKQLAIVISYSLFCSLLVSITLVPMLAAKTLHEVHSDAHRPGSFLHSLFERIGGFLSELEASYKRLLHYSLHHRRIVLTGTILIFIMSLALIPVIGVEFMPTSDEGEVRVEGEMEVGTKLDVIGEKFETISEIVRENVPEIKNTVMSVGGGGYRSSGSHNGELNVSLVPQAQRSRSSAEIATMLGRKLMNIPGILIRTREGQGMFMFRMMSGGTERVQIEVVGHDLATADALALRVKEEVEQVAGVTDARISREAGNPEEIIVIDRQKAADMGLTVSQIANALQTILSGTQAGFYHEGGFEYRIRVQIKDARQMDIDEVLDLSLTNASGQPVVLRNVVQIKPQAGPVRIERMNQERYVQVSANIAGRDMGSVIADASERLQNNIPVPKDFSIGFGGDYEEQQKGFRELLLSFILALILVYMVMACQYESFRDPFVVMFSIPLASVGVLLLLFLTDTSFNVQSFIGCIMLGGIVVNNAILLVDHTNLLRRRDKMELYPALEEAGRRRLRPILMTAMTTMLGLLPLSFGFGEGGEAQAPMARTVIGGLASSTFITLLVVPIIYSMVEERLNKKNRAKG